jgi:hypothetical protein
MNKTKFCMNLTTHSDSYQCDTDPDGTLCAGFRSSSLIVRKEITFETFNRTWVASFVVSLSSKLFRGIDLIVYKSVVLLDCNWVGIISVVGCHSQEGPSDIISCCISCNITTERKRNSRGMFFSFPAAVTSAKSVVRYARHGSCCRVELKEQGLQTSQ